MIDEETRRVLWIKEDVLNVDTFTVLLLRAKLQLGTTDKDWSGWPAAPGWRGLSRCDAGPPCSEAGGWAPGYGPHTLKDLRQVKENIKCPWEQGRFSMSVNNRNVHVTTLVGSSQAKGSCVCLGTFHSLHFQVRHHSLLYTYRPRKMKTRLTCIHHFVLLQQTTV